MSNENADYVATEAAKYVVLFVNVETLENAAVGSDTYPTWDEIEGMIAKIKDTSKAELVFMNVQEQHLALEFSAQVAKAHAIAKDEQENAVGSFTTKLTDDPAALKQFVHAMTCALDRDTPSEATFEFNGQEVLVSYAKYLLEYLLDVRKVQSTDPVSGEDPKYVRVYRMSLEKWLSRVSELEEDEG